MKILCSYLSILLFVAFCYAGNIVKLTRCDFQAPYKGEVIHLVGLIPPASLICFWFDDK